MPSLKTEFLVKKLHSLSGLVPIGAFLIEHLYSNYQAVGPGGAARFDQIVVDLQTNPVIIYLEIFGIGLPILFHAVLGLVILKMSRNNVWSYGTTRNWMYGLQRWTGLILILYIGYHVYNTRLYPHLHPEDVMLQSAGGAKLVSSAYMHNYFVGAHWGVQVMWLYVVGISAAVFHFANGLWNMGVHWGVTVGPKAQRISAFACGLVGVALLFLGLSSLLAFVQMRV